MLGSNRSREEQSNNSEVKRQFRGKAEVTRNASHPGLEHDHCDRWFKASWYHWTAVPRGCVRNRSNSKKDDSYMNYLSMVRPYQGSGRFLELISGSTSLAQEIIILIFPIGKSILSVNPISLSLP